MNNNNDQRGAPLSVSLDQLKSPGTKRRALIVSALLSPFAFLTRKVAAANPSTPAVLSESDLKPFREIATKKGAKFVVGSGDRYRPQSQGSREMHLDMDMVRASLDDAIRRTRKKGQTVIAEKLERLRANGTAAQQVEFVLGSGDKYFFPEDVEKWAAMAEKNKFHSFGVVCDTVCYVICKCSCWGPKECVQECTERCREIFC